MNIVEMCTADIVPYDRNPRKNDHAVADVARSIKKYGFKVPIVIDQHNTIVSGHTRWKAANLLGLETVPCVVADDLTEDQIKAFRLIDNKTAEAATWDFGLLAQEIEGLDLADFDIDWQLPPDIDWAEVGSLTHDSYERPEHTMLECPKCHHVDREAHFRRASDPGDEE